MNNIRKTFKTLRKELREAPDTPLLIISTLLVFAGILILASVSSSFALQKTGNSFFYLNHQIIVGLIPGLLGALICYGIPLPLFRKISFVLLAINIVLLVLVFFPGIGSFHGGANRWIFIGSYSFQPSEALKLTAILYMASWLTARIKPSRKASQGTPKRQLESSHSVREVFIPFIVV